jgi:hypothetical protein
VFVVKVVAIISIDCSQIIAEDMLVKIIGTEGVTIFVEILWQWLRKGF